MVEAYLALGSNIEPERNMMEALHLLADRVEVKSVSTVYLTEPLKRKQQPRYFNCVIRIETNLGPRQLKDEVISPIENALGRVRSNDKYASRTIDIDIIIYGKLHMDSGGIRLPDPEIMDRPFLALPLSELAPDMIIPQTNVNAGEIARKLKDTGMVPLPAYTAKLRSYIAKRSRIEES